MRGERTKHIFEVGMNGAYFLIMDDESSQMLSYLKYCEGKSKRDDGKRLFGMV
jgi:hypothetical protein